MPFDSLQSPPRPNIVITVGLPGSGKSTWLEGKPGVLSSDEIRRLLADDPDNQHIHAMVFRTLRFLLKTRLQLRRPVTYIDATNLTPKERAPYVRLASAFDSDAEAVFFDTPLEECLRRNLMRVHRVVPEEVITKMAARMVPPRLEEGFSRVSVVGI